MVIVLHHALADSLAPITVVNIRPGAANVTILQWIPMRNDRPGVTKFCNEKKKKKPIRNGKHLQEYNVADYRAIEVHQYAI